MPSNVIRSSSGSSTTFRSILLTRPIQVGRLTFRVRWRYETRLILSGSPSETGHVHWTVARPPNTLFAGRDDILRELEATVRDAVIDSSRPDQCRIVISGMGGQGKSEICLQLAHRVRQV